MTVTRFGPVRGRLREPLRLGRLLHRCDELKAAPAKNRGRFFGLEKVIDLAIEELDEAKLQEELKEGDAESSFSSAWRKCRIQAARPRMVYLTWPAGTCRTGRRLPVGILPLICWQILLGGPMVAVMIMDSPMMLGLSRQNGQKGRRNDDERGQYLR